LRQQVTLEGNILNFVRVGIEHGGYTEEWEKKALKLRYPNPKDYKDALEDSRQAVEQYLQVIESLQKEAK